MGNRGIEWGEWWKCGESVWEFVESMLRMQGTRVGMWGCGECGEWGGNVGNQGGNARIMGGNTETLGGKVGYRIE